MRVVVVGAGVVGLCTALALRREGADVSVLDRASVDHGASAANAGWVVPVLSAPLSGPGVLTEVATATLRGEGSVGVRPAAGLLGWAAGFLRSTRADRHRDGLRAVLALGARSVELFDELRASGVEFEMHRRGLLIAARTRHGLESAEALVAAARAAGYGGETRVHVGSAVQALEPALADAVVGVVHAVADAHVRPESLLAGLRAALLAEGATLRRGVAVRGVERDGGGWTVATTSGAVRADRVVLAAGVDTAVLLRELGVRVPLLAGTGYSVTASGTGTVPAHPVKLIEANLACSPFEGGLRLSGMFELGARGSTVRARALRRIRAGAHRYLRDWAPVEDGTAIAGMRPATPDSLPVIGGVPGHDGLFTATGHGTLGLTLAPATAAALVPPVLHGTPAPELAPFAVERFATRPTAAARVLREGV
ncbi:FAD-dependent oxidoreductase [Pseudonocardia sp. DSM 110487]|uniref:NAD(P)/FAD-dependent oxidoreductase n=1 Tax=Pseudonocardia sp. DSM 110487 TaxID=2865833 RepID=UPI001C6A5096|nr:FAD-dependent oxidoreductase [Pseudonocardia sp. DSM 110487]QYN36346.1 FAD-dependent oxidoreductase [Pseudonocardia sp. DSM 110487]